MGATWPGAEGADGSGELGFLLDFFGFLLGATWPGVEGADESGELEFLFFGL